VSTSFESSDIADGVLKTTLGTVIGLVYHFPCVLLMSEQMDRCCLDLVSIEITESQSSSRGR